MSSKENNNDYCDDEQSFTELNKGYSDAYNFSYDICGNSEIAHNAAKQYLSSNQQDLDWE